MLVVLPTPLTPMTRMTAGLPERSISASGVISSAMMSRRASAASSPVFRPFSRTRSRSLSTRRTATSPPTSARMSCSSRSSYMSSSMTLPVRVLRILPQKPVRVFSRPVFIFSCSFSLFFLPNPKNPIVSSYYCNDVRPLRRLRASSPKGRAFSKKGNALLGSPFGGAGERSETERARMFAFSAFLFYIRKPAWRQPVPDPI